MIKRLQRSSGANIHVAPDPQLNTPNAQSQRKISICGSKEPVWKAKALLDQIKATKKIPRLLWEMNDSQFQEEITIQDEKDAGLIIGRKGEHLKKLTGKAGCKMTIYEVHTESVNRAVYLTLPFAHISYFSTPIHSRLSSFLVDAKV